MPRFLKSISTVAFSVTGGSPGAGKVLTSDANGNGTWQTPSGSAPADGSITTAKLADTEITLYVKLNAEVFG
jgi:hypothetical protein